MKLPSSKLKGLIFIVLLGLCAGAVYLFLHRNEESTDDAALDGRAVIVSPKVAGYVKTLNINDNQKVKAGDVLLEIDPVDYALRRDRSAAALDAAKAQVIAAQATLEKKQSDLKRMQRLSPQARSQEQLELASSEEKAAEANVMQLQAQVKQAEAELSQAKKDLGDTRLIAPMDGYITKRGVERGDYVQTGQQLTSLVGTELWVIANFKETQIKRMHIGDAADISVDAFPSAKLHGKVDSIQAGTGTYFSAFPPENATGNFVKIVQRVPVKIVLDAPQDANLHLGPGMSVVPVVHVGSAGEKRDQR